MKGPGASSEASNADSNVAVFETIQRRLLQRLAPRFQSRFLSTEGPVQRIHALEGGQGPPLLLLHGGGGIAAAWTPILDGLAESFHVVAVDRPGCGLTDRFDYRSTVDYRGHVIEFVKSVLDSLGWRRTSILANSMGGYCALEFALANPDRVERLILAGAPAGVDRWLPMPFRLLGVPGLNRLLQATVESPRGIRNLFRRVLVAHAERVDPEIIELSRLNFRMPGGRRAWLSMLQRFRTMRGVRASWYIRPAVARLAVPTLFVWGDADGFAPPSSGRQLSAEMPNASIQVVIGAGHLPWLDAPTQVMRALRGWISPKEPARAPTVRLPARSPPV